jgi:glycosyltransferase involved in cell wall biosynthesis
MQNAVPASCVVIPSYQAARTLAFVIDGVRAHLAGASVIVVDDGSTDDTARVATSQGVRLVSHAANRGKGAALRSGIAEALEARATSIVTIDADGQHDAAALPALVAGLDSADVVIGARERSGTMPPHRRFTNSASSAAVSHITGAEISDAQSGFRAFTRAVAERVRPAGDGYEFETEFLVLAARAGFRISSVQVPTVYGGESHFRLWRDGARVVRTIWSLRRG